MSDVENSETNRANIMRVLGAQRPLVLAAHAAARAMCRLTLKSMSKQLLPQRTLLSSACRRYVWTPLLLRWARKVAAARSRGAVRAPALPAWPISQFHWHFHLAALSGSDRERREARTTVVTGLNSPSADRIAGTGYCRRGGPTGTIAGARSISAYPQAASIGRVRFAAAAQGAEADSWKASPALATERTSYKLRWIERAPVHARFLLRGEADSRRVELPRAPKAQLFLTHRLRQPGAQSFGRTRVVGRNASPDTLLTSTSMAPPSSIKTPAAMASTKRSIYALVQVGTKGFLPQTRSQAARTFLRSKHEHPAAHAFDSSRPSAVGRQPSEQTWRTRNPAATATHFSKHTAATPTASCIAMRRSVNLVWRASPTSSAPSGDTPRFGTTSAAGAPSTRSTQAFAQVSTTSSHTSDNTVVRATALDPVLADRLADDVIRRIDRRARIERERRGL